MFKMLNKWIKCQLCGLVKLPKFSFKTYLASFNYLLALVSWVINFVWDPALRVICLCDASTARHLEINIYLRPAYKVVIRDEKWNVLVKWPDNSVCRSRDHSQYGLPVPFVSWPRDNLGSCSQMMRAGIPAPLHCTHLPLGLKALPCILDLWRWFVVACWPLSYAVYFHSHLSRM